MIEWLLVFGVAALATVALALVFLAVRSVRIELPDYTPEINALTLRVQTLENRSGELDEAWSNAQDLMKHQLDRFRKRFAAQARDDAAEESSNENLTAVNPVVTISELRARARALRQGRRGS